MTHFAMCAYRDRTGVFATTKVSRSDDKVTYSRLNSLGVPESWPIRTFPRFSSSVRIEGENEAAGAAVAAAVAVE